DLVDDLVLGAGCAGLDEGEGFAFVFEAAVEFGEEAGGAAVGIGKGGAVFGEEEVGAGFADGAVREGKIDAVKPPERHVKSVRSGAVVDFEVAGVRQDR